MDARISACGKLNIYFKTALKFVGETFKRIFLKETHRLCADGLTFGDNVTIGSNKVTIGKGSVTGAGTLGSVVADKRNKQIKES